MNKVILMGRLTRDPEIRQMPNGISIARFVIAVNRRFKNDNGEYKADFISCSAWRQTGEFIAKYFHKGSMIAVTGSIQTGSYQKDGQTVYTTEVNVAEAYFTGEKAQEQSRPATTGLTPMRMSDVSDNFNSIDNSSNEFIDIDGNEEDLPF